MTTVRHALDGAVGVITLAKVSRHAKEELVRAYPPQLRPKVFDSSREVKTCQSIGETHEY